MRVTMDMNPKEVVLAMGGGNPGAITVLMDLCGGKGASTQQLADGIMDIMRLDDLKIYEHFIWIGYKDVCKQNIEVFREAIRDGSIKEKIEASERGERMK